MADRNRLMVLALFEIVLVATFTSTRATRYWMEDRREYFAQDIVEPVGHSPFVLDALPLLLSHAPEAYFGPPPDTERQSALPAAYDLSTVIYHLGFRNLRHDITPEVERMCSTAFQGVMARSSRETLVAFTPREVGRLNAKVPQWIYVFLNRIVHHTQWRRMPRFARLQASTLSAFVAKVGYYIENPVSGNVTDLRVFAAEMIAEVNARGTIPPFVHEFINSAPKRA